MDPKTVAIGGALVVAGVGAYLLLGSKGPNVVLTPDEQAKVDEAKQYTQKQDHQNAVDHEQYDANQESFESVYNNPANPLSGTIIAKWEGEFANWLDWQIQGNAKPNPDADRLIDAYTSNALRYLKDGHLALAKAAIVQARNAYMAYLHTFSQFANPDRIDPNLAGPASRMLDAEKAIDTAYLQRSRDCTIKFAGEGASRFYSKDFTACMAETQQAQDAAARAAELPTLEKAAKDFGAGLGRIGAAINKLPPDEYWVDAQVKWILSLTPDEMAAYSKTLSDEDRKKMRVLILNYKMKHSVAT